MSEEQKETPDASYPFGSKEELFEFYKKFGENGRTFKDMTALTPESMEAFYLAAYNQYNAGKYEDAEKVFKLLCTLDHFETKFWKGLGASRENLKDYEGAVAAYSYLTLLDMKDAYPPYHAAKNLLAMGKVPEAKAALQAAIFNSKDGGEHADLNQKAVDLLELVEKGEQAVQEASA